MLPEFKFVVDAHDETLTYFNKLFSQHEAKLQEYKAKLFEQNIKLDELTRTKNVYSQGNDFRKNIFSPIPEKKNENDKETQLIEEIQTLTESQDYYERRIEEETAYLRNLAKRINRLIKAKKVIQKIVAGNIKMEYVNKDGSRATDIVEVDLDQDDDDEEFIDLEAFLD
ncbi:MAG: hypothetical protein J5517_03935 [Eubacterium sp.]|nr:hypothetical protein [Eubacterium sp.]